MAFRTKKELSAVLVRQEPRNLDPELPFQLQQLVPQVERLRITLRSRRR